MPERKRIIVRKAIIKQRGGGEEATASDTRSLLRHEHVSFAADAFCGAA
jgi:hypothetical protein